MTQGEPYHCRSIIGGILRDALPAMESFTAPDRKDRPCDQLLKLYAAQRY